MNGRIFRNSAFIKALYYAEPMQRKHMIENMSDDEIRVMSDITENILNGRLSVNNVHKQKLKHYKRIIRFLASQRINLNRKRRTMLVFHNVIPLLIKPIAHLLDEF